LQHVPDAKNIPVVEPDASGRMLLNPRFVEITEANFGKDVKCVTGCQKGGRSIKAAELLLTAGFPNVLDMRGGFGGETDEVGRVTFPGWSLRRRPTTRDSAAEDRYEDLAKKLLSSPRQTNS
jgi:rhodanese-related sulfurtransferase